MHKPGRDTWEGGSINRQAVKRPWKQKSSLVYLKDFLPGKVSTALLLDGIMFLFSSINKLKKGCSFSFEIFQTPVTAILLILLSLSTNQCASLLSLRVGLLIRGNGEPKLPHFAASVFFFFSQNLFITSRFFFCFLWNNINAFCFVASHAILFHWDIVQQRCVITCALLYLDKFFSPPSLFAILG